jgi:hypothetical protein
VRLYCGFDILAEVIAAKLNWSRRFSYETDATSLDEKPYDVLLGHLDKDDSLERLPISGIILRSNEPAMRGSNRKVTWFYK